MIGHSVGEYVAAVLAGVFTAFRTRLLQHPRAVSIIGTRPSVSPAMLRLVEAIRRVHAGEPMLSPEVTSTLIAAVTDATSAASRAASTALALLTDREREVAVLMAQGLTNAQIGTRLHVSMASVKAHLSHIFTKLGVDNRVSAALVVRDAGLG